MVRPEDDANGLEVIRALITAANVALVVLDSFLLHNSQEVFAQLPSALSRVKGGLAKSQCVLLILLSRLPGDGIRANLDTLLHLERKAWLVQHDDIQGYQVEVTVLKDSQNRSERSVCIDIWLKGEPL